VNRFAVKTVTKKVRRVEIAVSPSGVPVAGVVIRARLLDVKRARGGHALQFVWPTRAGFRHDNLKRDVVRQRAARNGNIDKFVDRSARVDNSTSIIRPNANRATL